MAALFWGNCRIKVELIKVQGLLTEEQSIRSVLLHDSEYSVEVSNVFLME